MKAKFATRCYLPFVHQLWLALVSMALCGALGSVAIGESVINGPGGDGVPLTPATHSGGGSFFDRKLGTALRINYHTQSYGTRDAIVTVGGMKIFNREGATWFLDAQATLSREFGGGFNAGGGYRFMHDALLSANAQRISGVSFWTDGQSTELDNFFTQLGISLESLGEVWDMRFNAYLPVDREAVGRRTTMMSANPTYSGNFLFVDSDTLSIDTAHDVVDAELARRLFNLEAWAFIGGYYLGGGGLDDAGYRIGLRGYALPDLALSLQVTEDDVYDTNVVFGLTWFVGRTNSGNAPCGNLLDRFREPVLRNDFIALTQREEQMGSEAVTSAVTREDFVFIHVDSDAPVGGDGTFEMPYNNLADAQSGSDASDIILVHSGSTLTGNFAFADGQQFLGEGSGVVHVLNTVERGLLDLPETSPGAAMGPIPVINGVAGNVFTFANGNELNNATINGGTTALSATSVTGLQAANLTINSPTGDGVVLTDVGGTALIENSVAINNAGGRAMLIDGGSDLLGANATISNPTGLAVELRNRTGGLITFGEIESTTEGILLEDNSGVLVTFSNLVSLSTGANQAVTLRNNDGAAFDFDNLQAESTDANTVHVEGAVVLNINNGFGTSTITNSGAGTAVEVSGDGGPGVGDPFVFVAADVTNFGGGYGLHVRNLTGGGVLTSGTLIDSADGILITGNSGGDIRLDGTTMVNSAAGDALSVIGNSGVTVSTGVSSQLDIDTTSGRGIVVDGDSSLTINGTGHTIDTTAGGTGIDVNNATSVVVNDVTLNASGADAVAVSHTSADDMAVTLNNVTVASAGNSGIAVTANGAGELDVVVTDSTISGVGQQGLLIDSGASSNRVDFTLTDSSITANGNNAMLATLDEGLGDIRFLVQDNQFTNDSAASATVDIQLTTAATLNATIGSTITSDPGDDQAPPVAPIGDNNNFNNLAVGGDPFSIDVNAAGSVLNLDLRDNTAQGGTTQFVLTQTLGTFNLVDATDTINGDNNVGTVNSSGTINTIDPPVDTPTP